MELYQLKMIEEYKDLLQRTDELNLFVLHNPKFDKLDKKERALQVQQLTGMRVYLTALMDRLDHQNIKIE